jgi:uncharacterized protein YndB with AHSA1/START domain
MTEQAASQAKEIVVTRELDATPERVWEAWTQPEMVKRWWGPEGFTAPSIEMDVRTGGRYVWAMRGPAGSPQDRVMYNAGEFEEVVPHQKLVVTQYMSDEKGEMLPPPPGADAALFNMRFTVLFEALGKDRTRLSIIYPKPETEEQYQAMLKSGMMEGWQSSMNKLAAALG